MKPDGCVAKICQPGPGPSVLAVAEGQEDEVNPLNLYTIPTLVSAAQCDSRTSSTVILWPSPLTEATRIDTSNSVIPDRSEEAKLLLPMTQLIIVVPCPAASGCITLTLTLVARRSLSVLSIKVISPSHLPSRGQNFA